MSFLSTKIFTPIILLSTLFFASCGNKNDVEKDKSLFVDSTLSKLNSAELQAVNKKILENPNDPILYHQRAKLYFDNKDFEACIFDCKRSLNLDSMNADFYLTLSDAYFISNQTRNSKETLEKCAKLIPTKPESFVKLSELYFYVKQYQQSINNGNEALKLNPNLAKVYFIKGMCYKESGDTTKALSSFQTATEQDQQYYAAFVETGMLLAAHKNPLCLEYYNNALKISPNSVETMYLISKFYQDINKIKEAVEGYTKILVIKKNHPYALYNLGAIAYDVNKKPKDAIPFFSKAIASTPDYAEAYFARGACYQDLKDLTNAEADYRMAIQLKPNYENAIRALNKITQK